MYSYVLLAHITIHNMNLIIICVVGRAGRVIVCVEIICSLLARVRENNLRSVSAPVVCICGWGACCIWLVSWYGCGFVAISKTVRV